MDEASRRVWYLLLAVAAAGTVGAWWAAGSRVGIGFGAGAAISAVNYRWLHRTVSLIGSSERPGKWSRGLLALRYLILGAAAYGIVNYFELSVLAVIVGLLVAVAAVMLEILYELIFSRT